MTTDAFSLKDKIALVTGGSRGIGKAIALGFADAGADVIVASRKLPDLEVVADEIRKKGRRSLAVAANMSKMEDIEKLAKTVLKEFGRVDVLVNNAGTNPIFGPVINAEERAWDKIMDVNLKGYFFLSLALVNGMIDQGGGNIINIASTAGLNPSPMLGVYSVSKAGVIMLTRVLAAEWAASKIRVNAIAPGLLETKFSSALWMNPDIREEALKVIPMGSIGQPEDVVGAAIYLASDASAYVTGEKVVVSGGA